MAVFLFSHLVPQVQVLHIYSPADSCLLTRSDIYCASRSLYGLARDGQAPRLLAKARKNGNPIFAVGFTSLFICLGYMNASKSSATVFGYLVSLVTVFAVLNWVAILVSHIRFRQALKAQGISVADLPYSGFLQPYGSYFALFISLLVIVFNGKTRRHSISKAYTDFKIQGYDAFIPHFKVDTFILKYLGTILFIFNAAWWKVSKRTTFWAPTDVDLTTGRREWDETETTMDASWKTGFWKNTLRKFQR